MAEVYRSIKLNRPSNDMVVFRNERKETFLLIAGGGGQGNTGVSNAIQIAKISNGDTVSIDCIVVQKNRADIATVCTDFQGDNFAPYRIALGIINNTKVLSVTFLESNICALYKINSDAGTSASQDLSNMLTHITRFSSGPKENGEDITSLCMSPTGFVILGNKAGRCAVWKFDKDFKSEELFSLDCFKESNITSISYHYLLPVIALTSESGICKLLNINISKRIMNVISDISSSQDTSTSDSNKLIPFQRCCFSSDGSQLAVLQSKDTSKILDHKKPPEDGLCNLLLFDIAFSESKSDAGVKASFKINSQIQVSRKFPGKSLAMSDDGDFIAVGTTEKLFGGLRRSFAKVYYADTLKMVGQFEVSDYNIASLQFAHSATVQDDTEDIDAIVYGCSVNTLTCKKLTVGRSLYDKICATIALLIIVGLMFIFVMVIMSNRRVAGAFLDNEEDGDHDH
jgi:hypothetical protein